MVTYLEAPLKFEALFKKYASRKFLKVSIFVREKVEKGELRSSDFADEVGSVSEMDEDADEL